MSRCLLTRLLPGIFSKVKFCSRKRSFPGLSGQGRWREDGRESLIPGPNYNTPVKIPTYRFVETDKKTLVVEVDTSVKRTCLIL
jgi:hypothetical protein